MLKGLKKGDLVRVVGCDECIEDMYIMGNVYEFRSYVTDYEAYYTYNVYAKNKLDSWMFCVGEIERVIKTNKLGGSLMESNNDKKMGDK